MHLFGLLAHLFWVRVLDVLGNMVSETLQCWDLLHQDTLNVYEEIIIQCLVISHRGNQIFVLYICNIHNWPIFWQVISRYPVLNNIVLYLVNITCFALLVACPNCQPWWRIHILVLQLNLLWLNSVLPRYCMIQMDHSFADKGLVFHCTDMLLQLIEHWLVCLYWWLDGYLEMECCYYAALPKLHKKFPRENCSLELAQLQIIQSGEENELQSTLS